jgi:molybdate transport system permease protein
LSNETPDSLRSGTKWRETTPWLLASLGLPLLALLTIPLFALVGRLSFQSFLHYLSDRNTVRAIWLSCYTSVIATGLVVLTGTPLALLLARRQSYFARVVEIFVDLPTVFPPAIAGIALLLAFSRMGLVGSWFQWLGIDIAFTPAAVVLAQMFVAAPFYIKTAAIGFSAVNNEVREAASVHGAGSFRTLTRVIIPLSWRAIVSGTVLCWARAIGEFGATIIFAGNSPGRTQTMTLAVYIGFETDLDQALTLSGILLAASFTVLIVMRWVMSSRFSLAQN